MKAEVKNVVSFISCFEEAVVRYARDFDVDGVLCGHIHTAAIRDIQGVAYYNAGDWVESCTAIVERYDGTMELLHLAADAPPGDSIPAERVTKQFPLNRSQRRQATGHPSHAAPFRSRQVTCNPCSRNLAATFSR